MSIRRMTGGATAAAMAVVLAACGGSGGGQSPQSSPNAQASGSGQNRQAGDEGQQLVFTTPEARGDIDLVRWSLGTEPSSLDWVYSYDYPPNTVLANVCESLLRIGPDFSVRPNLAERVDNPDPLRWVYTIREGVTFHDGTPMTAEDVAFSLNRHLDEKVGSYWTTAYLNVKSVEVSGPRQVTVTLSKPDVLFNQLMAVAPGVVGSKSFVESKGKDHGTPDGGLNCTGPLKLDRWAKGESIRLTRHDGYWDAARRAKPAAVEFAFTRDPSSLVNALLAGQLDGAYGPPATGFGRLRSSGTGTLSFGPQTSTINLIVSDLQGPLADVRLRRALWLAIDRPGYIKAALGGEGEPSRAVAARFTWGQGPERAVYDAAWKALPDPAQNLDEAKRLVGEAGRPSRPVVVAASSAGTANALLATEVQAAGKRIGVDVEIKSIAPDAYGALFGDAAARKGIDLFFTSWYADIADPLQIYQNWQSKSFANYAGYKNPEYDRLYAEALTETDAAKRAQTTVKLQEIATRELLWLPIAQAPNSLFLAKGVTGAPTTNAYLYYPWAAQVGSAQ